MASFAGNARLERGRRIEPHELATVFGDGVHVPDADGLVHLQFRRFAGCPVCNLHLHSFVGRHADLRRAGIREIVVFHSSADDLRPHVSDLPFAVVADPHKQLYAEFGVDSSYRALLDPRAWLPVLRGVLRSLWGIVARRRPAPSMDPAGGRFGLPADFLIDGEGRVIDCKYGDHAYDQWSVDEVLEHAASALPGNGVEGTGPRSARRGRMGLTAAVVARRLVAVTGMAQVLLGIVFWSGHAYNLLPVHVVLGLTFVLAGWALAVLAALRGMGAVGVIGSAGWGGVVLALGMLQTRLLPGPLHWVIKALHLGVGVGAMVLASWLHAFIARRSRTAPMSVRAARGTAAISVE